MKIRLILISAILLVGMSVFGQSKAPLDANLNRQVLHEHHALEGCVLYESDLVRKVYYPYDLEKAKRNAKSGVAPSAVFDVDYIGFTDEAQSALQYSFDVLSTLITSPVPIRVSATFETLDPGVLGGARPNSYYKAYGDYYPSALADKIAGRNFNDREDGHDIILSISNTASWHYVPTDTTGIGNKFDLSTVMMHEIIHGLGFVGAARQASDLMFYRRFDDGDGAIYDRFVENLSGVPLTDLGEDQTTELEDALTSRSLYFNSPSLTERQKIYAPRTWSNGSSIYHLDESLTDSVDYMMTPQAARGEVRHDPGVATKMLLDMGWDFTTIMHEQEKSLNEDFTASYLVEASLISDSGFDTSSVILVYSQDTFQMDVNSIPMTYNMSTDKFEATIPAPNQEAILQYKINATQNGRITDISAPAFLTIDFYNYAYVKDVVAPVIEHADVIGINSSDIIFPVKAFVVDSFLTSGIVVNASGDVDTVIVDYLLNDGAESSFGAILTEDGFGEFYLADVPLPAGLTSADILKYRIRAIDESLAMNVGMYPADGSYISVPVNEITDPATEYTNDFNDLADTDFGFDQFEIAQISGFDDAALTNSVHPYPNAGDNQTLDFTATLNTPIIIAEDAASAFVKFKEIVLVEPSTSGSVFGETEFWDYVIVEAKKLSGGPWQGLLDGYDSRSNISWRIRYDSQTNGPNGSSTAVPIQTLYKDREFSLLDQGSPFVAGDTVLLRFRLFSDPFSVGWGWMIDNLNIQDANTNVAVEDFIQDENQFLVYPNPSNTGRITVAASFTQSAKSLRTELTDIHGRLIRVEQISDGAKSYDQEIDISNLPAGIYFMTLRDSESAITKKVVKY